MEKGKERKMQNPREDVRDVVLGLLDKPTLKGQADVIQHYCCPNVEFYYLYFNTVGIRVMTAIYQIAQVIANYQGVEFKQISYDEKTNIVGIWTEVLIQPWPIYFLGSIPLSIYTVLELENIPHGGHAVKGKQRTLKKIRVQRDYFEFSPIIRVIPIMGSIYANQQLRFILGAIQADIVTVGFKIWDILNPAKLWKY